MNEVVKTGNTTLPVSLEDMAGDASLGGALGAQDVAVPFLKVLQGLSPQIDPDRAEYIPGAVMGQLYLSGAEKVYDGKTQGLSVIFCHYERVFIEYMSTKPGSGFVARHMGNSGVDKDAQPNDKGILVLPNGHALIETAEHIILLKVPDGGWVRAVLPLKSTMLKISRRINYTMASTNIPNSDKLAPRFLYSWKITTVKEQKEANTWYVIKPERQDMVTADQYKAAKELAILARDGQLIKGAPSYAQDVAHEETNTRAPVGDNGQPLNDDQIPF